MDRDQWQIVLKVVKQVSRQVTRRAGGRSRTYPNWLIVAMLLWAVAHDRPPSWACNRDHYSRVFRPRRLPSVSWFNRRVGEELIGQILQQVHRKLAGCIATKLTTYLDGKPLTVGVASKDPDARRGHVMGGFAKGYKLHAWMSEDRRIPLWCVAPLNVDERPMASLLLQQAVDLPEGALTLVDQNYDTHDLHKTLHALNGRLMCRPKGDDSGARHAVTLRQMGPARRELLEQWARQPQLMRWVMKDRVNAEGIFGNLTSYGGGLNGLPSWVRRIHRVRRWVGCKIILYHARLEAREARKRVA